MLQVEEIQHFFRMSEDEEKVKLRRLEPAIQKFTKIVIPTDLERLRKHQINIEKYQRCRIWDKLHEEHINAGRTVQQLRSNIREMEKLCLKVQKDDLGLLKRMIDPVKEEASAATAEFLQLHLESVEELKKQFNDEETLLQPSLTRSMTVGGTFHTTEDEADPQSMTQIYVLPEIPRDQNAAESWETLEADLIELSQLVTDFSLLVNRFWIIFTIITLNSFSGRLPISSSFIWSCRFLPCSFICAIYFVIPFFFFGQVGLCSCLTGWLA
ncbi:syntaxin-17 isoform X2 [Orcinus orca]|uniref:syntaxin-17 isoform X2 n=1 Tax=Orcinus orca TaxID=9733 RepID=UPI002110F299|nr:syntaxin-17 isoform X2 [Orcinus orca]